MIPALKLTSVFSTLLVGEKPAVPTSAPITLASTFALMAELQALLQAAPTAAGAIQIWRKFVAQIATFVMRRTCPGTIRRPVILSVSTVLAAGTAPGQQIEFFSATLPVPREIWIWSLDATEMQEQERGSKLAVLTIQTATQRRQQRRQRRNLSKTTMDFAERFHSGKILKADRGFAIATSKTKTRDATGFATMECRSNGITKQDASARGGNATGDNLLHLQ